MSERFDVRRRLETPAGIRYGAVDSRTGRAARLQRIPDDGADYVVDDAAFAYAAARLPAVDHPNLVPVLELGDDPDGAYAAFAYAEGETLSEWLAVRGPLNVKDTLSVATDCLLGLAALDLAGLRHGDPHPHRILVKRSEHQRLDARLAEVGVALLSHPSEPVPPGEAIPWRHMAFLAPEVIRHEPADVRADLHTLGCTLYLCLTGAVPFDGENEHAIAQARLTAEPVPLLQRRRDVPPKIAEWVMALIAPAPDARPASAALALHSLEAALGRNTVSQRLYAVPAPPARPIAPVAPAVLAAVPGVGMRPYLLTALCAVVLGVGGMWAWESYHSPRGMTRPSSRPAAPPAAIARPVPPVPPPPVPKNVQGRFVRIELPPKKVLTLAEVQVFSGGRNVAPQGRATQSSTASGGDAPRAVDGRTDGKYNAGTSTHTSGADPQTWWELDLRFERTLDAVTVWTRTDENGKYAARLAGFQVVVLDAARRETFRSPANPAPRESARIELIPGSAAPVPR